MALSTPYPPCFSGPVVALVGACVAVARSLCVVWWLGADALRFALGYLIRLWLAPLALMALVDATGLLVRSVR